MSNHAPRPVEESARGLPGQSAIGGLVTGVAGLAVSLAAAGLLNERISPVVAVAEAIAKLTPADLAESAIQAVGTADKPLLRGGVILGLLLLSALAGRLAARDTWRGQLVFLVMAGLALGAVLGPGSGAASAVVPVIAGAVVWLVVLPVLVPSAPSRHLSVPPDAQEARGAPAEAPRGDGSASGLGRRAFLVRTGIVAALSLVAGVGSELVGRRRLAVEAARARLRLPVGRGTVPSGADLGLDGVVPWRVPNPEFYRIDTAFAVPTVDVDAWRLRIHGLVEQELTVSFADLLDREQREAWVTLCCVSNPVGGELIGNAWWSGPRVADLLAEARPLPGADAVLQTSEDDWTCGTPLEALTDDRDALLAVAMNGEPLPLEHGFPVRMVVPGLYGFVSATKWLVDLEVTRFADFSAYWTDRGWAEQAPVRTHSRIDVPGANTRASAGRVPVGGIAWAQHVGIVSVEVKVDDGPWSEMKLGRVPSDDTWVQWGGSVEVTPGVHQLAVRATDRSGYTQTEVRRDVVPDGATGWHTIEFTAE